MPQIGKHTTDEIRDAMRGKFGPHARALAEQLSERYGVSVTSIYKLTRDIRPPRKNRGDTGQNALEDTAAGDRLASLISGNALSVRQAREICIRENFDMPSLATCARYIRIMRMSAREREKDLTPCVRFEAEYPNRLWQVDASGSTMFYLDADGSIEYINPIRHTKNKPQPTKPRVWIISVLDDFSRACWAEFAPANDTQAWLHALGNAAREKGPEFPFCGLPEELYTDNDSVVKSARWSRILSLFDPPIAHTTHLPYHSRATGKVERMFRRIKHEFEAEHAAFRIPGLDGTVKQDHHQPTKWKSLAEANEYLRAWLIQYNNARHSGTGASPFERWVAGTFGRDVRTIDEATLRGRLLVDQTERQVNRDLTISLNNTRYALPPTEPWISLIGKNVTLWWSPEISDAVWVDHLGVSVEIHPAGAPVAVGDYRAIKISRRDLKRRMMARAESTPPAESAPTPAEVTRDAPRFVHKRPEHAVVAESEPTPRVLTRTRSQALTWLREHYVFHSPIEPHERDAFNTWWSANVGEADAVPFDELKRFAEAWRNGGYRKTAAGGAG